MKKYLTVVLLVLSTGLVFAAEQKQKPAPQQKVADSKAVISLAAARARIDAAIKDPKVMKAIMKNLSAADQKQFLAEVNKAISSMPGSAERKAAAFMNANMAAIDSAAKGNTSAIIAETFATVPPEMLPPIVQQMAEGPLSRKSVGGAVYTDAQFEKIATDLMKKIVERCAETDNPSPRSTLAIVMLAEASPQTAANLSDKLVETLPSPEARELAREEWLPAALPKDGRQGNFEPILSSADVTRRPDYNFVLAITGVQYHESVLQDLFGRSIDGDAVINTRTPVLDAIENRLERATMIGGENGGDVAVGMADPDENKKADVPEGEGGRPYQWQKTH